MGHRGRDEVTRRSASPHCNVVGLSGFFDLIPLHRFVRASLFFQLILQSGILLLSASRLESGIPSTYSPTFYRVFTELIYTARCLFTQTADSKPARNSRWTRERVYLTRTAS